MGGECFAVDTSLIAADANKQRSMPGDKWRADGDAGRALQEYLATLDDTAFGAASAVTPKFISQSDPAAQWTDGLASEKWRVPTEGRGAHDAKETIYERV